MRIWYTGILLLVFSCQQAGDKSKELARDAKQHAKEAWKKTVDKGFDALTTTESSSFKKVFGEKDVPEVTEIDGLRIDWPAGFYYIFLVYRADKQAILKFIEQQPAHSEDYSDKAARESDGKRIFENLDLIGNDHPHLLKEVEFFLPVRKRKGLQFYECTRFPRKHYVAFDPESGRVYHHIENLAD